MLDLQHVPNIKGGKRLIKNFTVKKSVAIAIPSHEHSKIKYCNYLDIKTARTLLAREIKILRKYTGIPSMVFNKIIEANKKMYPESFKK